jgi:hypothetical protein
VSEFVDRRSRAGERLSYSVADGDVRTYRDRSRDGASFLVDLPAGVPAVWGHSDDVLWAEGEPAMLYGGSGVGKSTLAQQVALARLELARPRCWGCLWRRISRAGCCTWRAIVRARSPEAWRG